MRCYQCGAENAEGSRFCNVCGAVFSQTPTTAYPPPGGWQQQYSPNANQQYSQGPNQQYVPGMDQQYSQGPNQQYAPGMNQQYAPGMDQQYAPGMDQPGWPGGPQVSFVQDRKPRSKVGVFVAVAAAIVIIAVGVTLWLLLGKKNGTEPTGEALTASSSAQSESDPAVRNSETKEAPAGQITEPSQPSAEQPTERPTERPAEASSERPPEPSSERPAELVSERPPEPSSEQPPEPVETGYTGPVELAVYMKVALVTDYGSVDDSPYNQAAWEGVKEFCNANNVEYTYYRPASDSTDARVEAIETAINDGYNVIVMPGYLFGEAVVTVQDWYPGIYFIAVDMGAGNLTFDYNTYYDPAPNTLCITFEEDQAGYLAGYAAVADGYRQLGFLGSMDLPAVMRYGYGFVQGANAAAEEMGITDQVSIRYTYGGQFFGDASITARMDDWYASGTEVVFACGGGIYTSVL